MSMNYTDVAAYNALTQRASSAAQATYNQAMASNSGEQLALARAKQAFDAAIQTATLSGYFGPGVGNGTVAGQATMPNIQYTTGEFGQYIPGGFNQVTPGTPTQAAIQNQQQYGLSQAAATGVYYDPGQMTYRPGTFIRDQDTGGIGQIQSNGRLQMFGDQGDFLRAGGNWDMLTKNPDMIRNVSTQEYNQLANDPNYNFSSGGRSPTATMALQQMYGSYGMPKEGQQTLANINQQNQIAQNWADRYGYTPQFDANGQPIGLSGGGAGGVPGQGSPQTLTAQQQYWNQAFSEAQANQKNTQAYLGILSNLRGPADWAKYQQVLGSTPQGLRDLYAASMGQYTPGGGATTGVQPQAVDLNTMQQQIGGGGGYGQMPSYNYTTNPGQYQYPSQTYTQGGNQVWGSGLGVGAQSATPDQQIQATGNGTNMYGGQQQQYNLPAPNQIAAQSWNNFTPSQKQMMLGMYEAQGYDKGDVEALYTQALPKYGASAPSVGTWSQR